MVGEAIRELCVNQDDANALVRHEFREYNCISVIRGVIRLIRSIQQYARK